MGRPAARLRAALAHLRTSTPPPAPTAAAATPTPWGDAGILTADDVAFRSTGAEDAEACASHLLEKGFLIVDNILTGAALAEAQAQYMAAMQQERALWAAAGEAGEHAGQRAGNTAEGRYSPRYFDMPRIVEQADCFLEIVTHPRIVSVLELAIGPEVQVINIQCRCYPQQTAEDAAGGYSGWHNDRGYGVYHDNQRVLHVVAIFNFFDVEVDGGCTAVVPVRPPPVPSIPSTPNRQDKPPGWPAGCFWALGSGLGLVGTVSARR